MKKGKKGALLAALICIVAGGILAGAGYLAGGVSQLYNIGIHKISEDVDVQEEEEILTGTFDRVFSDAPRPEKLQINTVVSQLEIVEADTDTIQISGTDCDRLQCYVRDNTLYVSELGREIKWGVHKTTGGELVLTIPEGTRWETAQITAECSQVRADRLHAKKMELKADLGEIVIGDLTAETTTADTALGIIEVGQLETKRLDCDTQMGKITLALSLAPEDYDYEIRSEYGNIVIAGEAFTGTDCQKQNPESVGKMSVSSYFGDIDISFIKA